ncbi:MAG: hypothetical protein KAU95_03395 [Candidatus Aenigmarchaeota archaeon]|nr:hypothetical protein [Candidatus Aenigmarchaeota archaeon]
MVKLILKIPEELKKRMDKYDWVDWSKVALRAISERLEDIKGLERKFAELSKISPDDKRKVK